MSEDWREKIKRFSIEGKPTVEVKEGTRMPNSLILHLHLEDHTMGELLRMELLKRKEVKFAGYRVLHPLDDKVEVRVQTVSEADSPAKTVCQTLNKLSQEVGKLIKRLDQQTKE